jgi:hypothetical protein
MCAHRLNDGPLICDRRDTHDEHARGGHTFTASWLGDNHDKTEARDE